MDSGEALHEHLDEVAIECKDNEYLLEFPNFHLRPLHFQTIVKGKVEDEEENFESTTCVICWLKIDSRMGVDGTFLVLGFFMEPRIKKNIFQMELIQIKGGLKRPVPQGLSDLEFSTLFILSSKKPALMLVLDVEPKMWPLLQLSQLIRAIPSSGFINHQQPNGEFEEEEMDSEVTKKDAPPTLLGSTSGKGVLTSFSVRPPLLPMQLPPLPPPLPPPQPAPAAPAVAMNIELTQVRGAHINENLTDIPLNAESEITEEDPSLSSFPLQPDNEPLLDDESTEEVEYGCCDERFNCCCPIFTKWLSFCSSMFQSATSS